MFGVRLIEYSTWGHLRLPIVQHYQCRTFPNLLRWTRRRAQLSDVIKSRMTSCTFLGRQLSGACALAAVPVPMVVGNMEIDSAD